MRLSCDGRGLVEERRASDLFVECLEAEGVRHVFGIPGEETLDLNESLERSSIEFVPEPLAASVLDAACVVCVVVGATPASVGLVAIGAVVSGPVTIAASIAAFAGCVAGSFVD